MLFIPEKKVKATCKRLINEGKARMEKESLERRQEYLQAEKEGKLDEYFEKLRKNMQYL